MSKTEPANDANVTIDENLLSFMKHMPKVELHAHLNGCIRESTLVELARERNVTLTSLFLNLGKNKIHQVGELDKRRSLSECFEVFHEVANCVNDLNALKRITREALDDFAKENVAYLELRSTPKVLFYAHEDQDKTQMGKGGKCTKKEYVESILKVIEEFSAEEDRRSADVLSTLNKDERISRLPMVTRFIISIDRSGSMKDAIEHATLAEQFTKDGNEFVVGVDLSGNPLAKSFIEFAPAFDIVRKAGLRSTIHCGEVPCGEHVMEPDSSLKRAFEDAEAIIKYRPDRLGHALLLPESVVRKLEVDKIPIECCPTSNVMTLELAKNHHWNLVEGLRKHPRLESWLSSGYPISISTDDPGIFNTDSTQEFVLLAMALDLKNPSSAVSIVIKSIDHIFESPSFRESLKSLIIKQIEMIAHNLHFIISEKYSLQ